MSALEPRNTCTEPWIRSWLENRVQAFVPRVKKTKPTKVAAYTFTLEELIADIERTLTELKERTATNRKGV